MTSNIFEQLPDLLLPWYEQNKRNLPWRKTREPYHVWLSEIMLQQTRVEAVKGYYTRFLEALPSIDRLASCEDEQLYKLWEGLGYYSRVRNLKKAACQIMERHGGVFPDNYDDIRALAGIGDYTAGAISSICFDMPRAAVDGNVLRVVSRLTENDTPIDLPQRKREVTAALESVYPAQAGEFTQALMELGATLCGPNWAPKCDICPCREICAAALHGTALQYPVKLPKKEKREERKTVFILCCDGRFALQKRPDTGLLAGLWQFPNVEGHLDTEKALEKLEQLGVHPREIIKQVERRHIFTHIIWKMRGIYLEVAQETEGYHWLTAEEIQDEAALPTAFRQFFEEADHV